MTVKDKTFRYFIHADDTLPVHLQVNALDKPILWNRQGLYGIIPAARLQNAYEIYQANPMINQSVLYVCEWYNVKRIPSTIARLLICEDA